jgi:hypothetical protein
MRRRFFMPEDKRDEESVPDIEESGSAAKQDMPEKSPSKSRADMLEHVLRTYELKLLDAKNLTPTLAEYLKLLQVERDLEPELPKEITVRWVETLIPFIEK